MQRIFWAILAARQTQLHCISISLKSKKLAGEVHNSRELAGSERVLIEITRLLAATAVLS
jgi:hypothetical protein